MNAVVFNSLCVSVGEGIAQHRLFQTTLHLFLPLQLPSSIKTPVIRPYIMLFRPKPLELGWVEKEENKFPSWGSSAESAVPS